LKLFTVLVKHFEIISKIVENSAENTINITADEFFAKLAAEVIDSNSSLVGCFCQNEQHRTALDSMVLQ